MSKSLTLPAAPVPVQDSQDQDDLHIVEYLSQDNLPQLLSRMLSQASTPAEQDMLLMSTLTAASAVLPNLYFRYGKTGKKYYANLQCFILAAAASGKGIAGQALEMIEPIQAMYPILIPGDSTFPAFFKRLFENGTFSQYSHLVPSIENGYFSRLLPVIVRDTQPFNKSIVEADGHTDPISRQVGLQLLSLYKSLSSTGDHEWSLTPEQKSRLAAHLASEYTTLIDLLGTNFHSAVVRMAVQIERIAMILSALRLAQPSSISPELNAGSLSSARNFSCESLTCSDEDYSTAELIGSKLILHMASAYKLIAGDQTELVPPVATTCQKQLLFSQLPNEYAHKILVNEAIAHGVSSATAARWNEKWLDLGMIRKARYGIYQKVI